MYRRWVQLKSLAAAVLHPVRLLPLAFFALMCVGTVLLMLPFSHTGGGFGRFWPAAFTSVSASSVTGLTTVDVDSYWSLPGQVIILSLVEVGGIGVMTLTTMLVLVVGGKLGLRSRLIAQAEMQQALSMADLRPLLRRVIIAVISFQLSIGIILTVRFAVHYDYSLGESVWQGIFHSIMGFNNAGFALRPDSLAFYAGDPWIILLMSGAVYAGALGFPVLAELSSTWRKPKRWSMHTRLTVWGSLLLFVLGTLAFTAFEWNNPDTLGPMSIGTKIVSGIEGGVMPRSGGLSSVNYGIVTPETLNVSIIMMFIGGGSASTAGGIKVTTFFLLAFVVLAELRGDPQVRVGRRAVSPTAVRQALTIALLAVMLLVVTSLVVLMISGLSYESVLFECASAFGTVGLSTGITGSLPHSAQAILMLLMFIGRVGPIILAAATIMRRRVPRYHLPEERPIIG